VVGAVHLKEEKLPRSRANLLDLGADPGVAGN